MANDVGTQGADVTTMLEGALPVSDVIKGGKHMRAQGATYLPRFPMESDEDYNARRDSTWLFNGVKKARNDIVGRIMSKPVTLKTQEGQLFEWCQNIDLEGRDLSNFAKDTIEAALVPGLSFIMADAPPREGGETVGQARSAGLRPYLVNLTLDNVVGWRWENIGNAPTLTQFRIMESVADPDRGAYDDDEIEQIRELSLEGEGKLRRVVVRLWRIASKDKAWEQYGEDMATDFPEIYVVPYYTGRTGFFKAEPPLSDIAELNLAHWRVQSDKSSCLHKSLAPLLFMKQIDLPEGQGATTSASYGFTADAEGADMRWIEITGAGIDKGSAELEEIKDQMKQMGLQLISERIGVSTATGDNIDERKSVSRIQMWADDLKDSLEIALGWMRDIGGIKADTEVEVNKEFGLLGNLPLSEVKEMYLAGVISAATYINEAKRRGVLAEDVSPEDEAELAEGEGLDDER